MEPPISLDGEDIRNEKVHYVNVRHSFKACIKFTKMSFFQVKVLRSIRKLDPSDVILGQYKASTKDKVDIYTNSLTPTYFTAALYIDNARWDGVPFLVKTGIGLIRHRSNYIYYAFLLLKIVYIVKSFGSLNCT